MEKYITLLKYEIIACTRQMKEVIRYPKMASMFLSVLLMACCIAMSIIKSSSQTHYNMYSSIIGVSMLLGWSLFGKHGVAEVMLSDKATICLSLPVHQGIYKYIKIKKKDYPLYIVILLLSLVILLSDLLSKGKPQSALILFFVCSVSGISMHELHEINAILKTKSRHYLWFVLVQLLALLLVAVKAFIVIKNDDVEGLTAFVFNARIYILVFSLIAIIVVQITEIEYLNQQYKVARSQPAMSKVNLKGFSHFGKNNFIGRKDLLAILNNESQRRQLFLGFLITSIAPIIAAIIARQMRMRIEFSSFSLFFVICWLTSSSLSSSFQRLFCIGYEGNWIILYVLSGVRIAKLQLLRVESIATFLMPLQTIIILVCALILRIDIRYVLTCEIACALEIALFLLIDAHHMAKNTSYFNDIKIPDLVQSILARISKAIIGLQMLLLPVTYEYVIYTASSDNIMKAVTAGEIILQVCEVIIYLTLTIRGNTKYYGEYQYAISFREKK